MLLQAALAHKDPTLDSVGADCFLKTCPYWMYAHQHIPNLQVAFLALKVLKALASGRVYRSRIQEIASPNPP